MKATCGAGSRPLGTEQCRMQACRARVARRRKQKAVVQQLGSSLRRREAELLLGAERGSHGPHCYRCAGLSSPRPAVYALNLGTECPQQTAAGGFTLPGHLSRDTMAMPSPRHASATSPSATVPAESLQPVLHTRTKLTLNRERD